MYILRTRFKKDIVAEFLAPKRKSQKVIIFCDGMPSVPSKKKLLEFFAKKGYWVFHPRYRGSWESGGRFLKISPHQDILDIIGQLPRGFKNLWSGEVYKLNPKSIYIFGSSFGGTAAVLASADSRITKAVAFSPVVDWTARSKAEPFDKLHKFTKEAFGNGYRFSKKDWDKLKSGEFYNPAAHVSEIKGNKIFIIHAKDDDIVNWRPVQKFAKKTGCRFLLLKKGGHLSSSNLIKPRFYKRIKKFLGS